MLIEIDNNVIVLEEIVVITKTTNNPVSCFFNIFLRDRDEPITISSYSEDERVESLRQRVVQEWHRNVRGTFISTSFSE